MISEISAKEFAKKVQSQKPQKDEMVIIDVCEPEEWHDYHLEDSKLMPLGTLHQQIHALNKQQKIYVICAHGVRSFYAAQYLLQQGFSDVVNVEGGIQRVRLYLEEFEK